MSFKLLQIIIYWFLDLLHYFLVISKFSKILFICQTKSVSKASSNLNLGLFPRKMSACSLWLPRYSFSWILKNGHFFRWIYNVLKYKWCIKCSSHERYRIGIFHFKISLGCHSISGLSRYSPSALNKWPILCSSGRHAIEKCCSPKSQI